MTTRPTLLGYVRADALSCAEELAAATDSLVAFASAEGFTLGTVYTERDAAESAAFHALLDEVKRSDVRAVVVPTMNHLGLGPPVPRQRCGSTSSSTRRTSGRPTRDNSTQASGADVLTPASASVPLSTSTAAPGMPGR